MITQKDSLKAIKASIIKHKITKQINENEQ